MFYRLLCVFGVFGGVFLIVCCVFYKKYFPFFILR